MARDHFEAGGVADRVEIRLGNAHDSLKKLANESPFDFVLTYSTSRRPPSPMSRAVGAHRCYAIPWGDAPRWYEDGPLALPDSSPSLATRLAFALRPA